MKQFNLEEYLRLKEEGKEPRVVTRNGHSVRIICTDRKSCIPLVVLVEEDNIEYIEMYTTDGIYPANHDYDLFFAPTKHEGWVNLYKCKDCAHVGRIHATEEEAKAKALNGLIATVKIEWTE